jgi:hypothetical protein
LRKGVGDLSHHHAGWITVIGKVITVSSENANAAADQEHEAKLLGDRSRANREASSTMTMRTPLFSKSIEAVAYIRTFNMNVRKLRRALTTPECRNPRKGDRRFRSIFTL